MMGKVMLGIMVIMSTRAKAMAMMTAMVVVMVMATVKLQMHTLAFVYGYKLHCSKDEMAKSK